MTKLNTASLSVGLTVSVQCNVRRYTGNEVDGVQFLPQPGLFNYLVLLSENVGEALDEYHRAGVKNLQDQVAAGHREQRRARLRVVV